jgi:hypothetical protein
MHQEQDLANTDRAVRLFLADIPVLAQGARVRPSRVPPLYFPAASRDMPGWPSFFARRLEFLDLYRVLADELV